MGGRGARSCWCFSQQDSSIRLDMYSSVFVELVISCIVNSPAPVGLVARVYMFQYRVNRWN